MLIEERLKICQSCDSYRDDYRESDQSVFCRAKGDTPSCKRCRASLLAEYKNDGCPEDKWGELPTLNQAAKDTPVPCIHFDQTRPGQGRCKIGVYSHVPVETCLRACKQRVKP